MQDGRVWSCLGIVKAAEDDGQHWEIDQGTMLVQVKLQPSGDEVDAQVLGGAFGWGVWFVPPIGAEVIVAVPDGELDFSPVIVAVLASGSLPDGLAENQIQIVVPSGGEVLVNDGGTTEPLVRKSEYDALKAKYDAHEHFQFGYPGGGIDIGSLVKTSGPDSGVATTGPAPGITPDPAPTITGTNILKAQ
jgi:hypothetical protein